MKDKTIEYMRKRDCILGIVPDKGGMWVSSIRPDSPRDYSYHDIRWTSFMEAISKVVDTNWIFKIKYTLHNSDGYQTVFSGNNKLGPVTIKCNMGTLNICTIGGSGVFIEASQDGNITGTHEIEINSKDGTYTIIYDGEIICSEEDIPKIPSLEQVSNIYSKFNGTIDFIEFTCGDVIWNASYSELNIINPKPLPLSENLVTENMTESERVQLLTKINTMTDNGAFESFDKTKQWGIITQLKHSSLIPSYTIIIDADWTGARDETFISCAQQSDPNNGFFIIGSKRKRDGHILQDNVLFVYSGENMLGDTIYVSNEIECMSGRHILFFVVDYSERKVRVYIDGIRRLNRNMDENVNTSENISYPPNFSETSKPVILGSDSNEVYSSLKIFNCSIFDRALSEEEIRPFFKRNIVNSTSTIVINGNSLSMQITPVGQCVVDFGDGTYQKYDGNPTSTSVSHTYSESGNYTVKIKGNHSTFRAPSNTVEAIRLAGTITSCREMFKDCKNLTYINPLLIPYSVTNCSSMFRGCSGLTEVYLKIPQSVTNCSQMFYGCSKLTTVKEGFGFVEGRSHSINANSMFQNCTSLISLPSTFKIPNIYSSNNGDGDCTYMFGGCTSLSSIANGFYIGNSASNLRWMFSNCKNLTSIPSSLTIPDSATNCYGMFANCTSLISLPSTFKIKESNSESSPSCTCYHMFSGCTGLTTISEGVSIGDSVTNCNGMFYGCKNLTSIPSSLAIPNSVTNCYQMFYNCQKVSSIAEGFSIGNSVTNCSYMFYQNVLLENLPSTLVLGESVTNCENMFHNCSVLKTLPVFFTIPNSVTKCGSMFNRCYELNNLPGGFSLGNSVEDCGSMFYRCENLTSIPSSLTIPDSVNLCNSMFSGCESLTSVPSTFTLGNSVTQCIGMFEDCYKLTSFSSSFKIIDSGPDCTRMFSDCYKLTWDISNIWPDFTRSGPMLISTMFAYCHNITGTVPADKLWNSGKTFNSTRCFEECTSLTNYDEIPDGWK